jgi:hypothetical protein
MPAYATQNTARESGPSSEGKAQGADEKLSAVELGIGFDGRYYRYRDYRYDRLSDAITYAKLESLRSGGSPSEALHPWLEPLRPTEAEGQLMGQFRITFDGRCYIYDGYRYEHCIDAVNYAKLKEAGQKGG